MKLKLDENLGERGQSLLANAGHDASTVVAQGMQSYPDTTLIAACRHEGRALITLDLDFANPLNFRPSEYAGIAVLRLSKPATTDELLQLVGTLVEGLKGQPIAGKLWIVEKNRIRIFQEHDES